MKNRYKDRSDASLRVDNKKNKQYTWAIFTGPGLAPVLLSRGILPRSLPVRGW